METPAGWQNFSLPDVDAGEHPEHQTEDESHGHGEQRGQQAVKDEFDQLKHGVASYPHSVEAVCGDGLSDDIFETNLSHRTSRSGEKNMISAGKGKHDFQVFMLQITNVTMCYIRKKGGRLGVDNSCCQVLHCLCLLKWKSLPSNARSCREDLDPAPPRTPSLSSTELVLSTY